MRTISQGELQEDLQRFQGRFTSRLADASAPLVASSDPTVRRKALDLQLRFASSALDIALGPDTDANLLDMVTFVELSRLLLDDYWDAKVFRGQTADMADALKRSSDDVWQVARKVLSEPEEAQLRRIIEKWRADNPGHVHVAFLRLSALANPANDAGFKFASPEVHGMFAGVKKAVQSADQARQLGERAMYAVQRLPFLIRTQARLAGQELFADAKLELTPVLRTTQRMMMGALVMAGVAGCGLLLFSLRRR